MNALEFCYSLQGFAELSLSKSPTEDQWAVIMEKLADVEYGPEPYEGLMDPQSFVNWLKGFVEIAAPKKITIKQWNVIKEHVGLVFTKVTKETVGSEPVDVEEIMKELDKIKDRPTMPPPYPPYQPTQPWDVQPWNPPIVTCDTKFCSSTTQDMLVC